MIWVVIGFIVGFMLPNHFHILNIRDRLNKLESKK